MRSSTMKSTKNKYYQGPSSDHFDGARFFNPDGETPKQFRDLWRWRMGPKPQVWPKTIPLKATATPKANIADLTITMVGHATLLIQFKGLNILTDPFWSDRASPVSFAGPKRVIKPGINFDDLPKIDFILLSHCHYDHMDLATLKRLKLAHDPIVVTPLGNDTIIKSTGLKTQTLDWAQEKQFGNLTIHCEPCHHWGARGISDRSMALWAAFVLSLGDDKVLFIGDTGFDKGRPYYNLAQKFGGFRAAVLPIGAYDPRWFMAGQHQNPAEAVQGFQIINADYAIGHHWGTIQLTNEGRDDPKIELEIALKEQGVESERFRALEAGDVWAIPHPT
jgi:L-ascorbate metabolism protein UlaG (beta-lactamase superfamily)